MFAHKRQMNLSPLLPTLRSAYAARVGTLSFAPSPAFPFFFFLRWIFLSCSDEDRPERRLGRGQTWPFPATATRLPLSYFNNLLFYRIHGFWRSSFIGTLGLPFWVPAGGEKFSLALHPSALAPPTTYRVY